MPDPRPIVFCDFDGTVTTKESLVALLHELLPGKTQEVMEKLISGQLTVLEGVKDLVESIPSSRFPEIESFSQTLSIRPGFTDFLDFLDSRQVDFVLLSGGLLPMVKTVLGPLARRCRAIHALGLDTAGPYLSIQSDYMSGTELMAKKLVMDEYSFSQSVAIGDGITDQNMALAADLVFARKRLALFLRDQGKDCFAWKDFFDVKNKLREIWG